MDNDGYTLDEKRDFIDGKGDIPDIIKKFKSKSKSQKCFSVKIDQIKENDYKLTPSNYKKYVPEEDKIENPIQIIDDILKLETVIKNELTDIRKILKKKD